MERPLLYCRRGDRLVSRLKMMLYGWRFIDQVGGQLVMLWPALDPRYGAERDGYRPGMIFDLDRWEAGGGGERLRFVETEEPLPRDTTVLDGPAMAERVKAGFDRAMFAGGGRFRKRGFDKFRFADEPADWAHRIAGMRDLFRSLPVHPDVLAARDAFYAAQGLVPGGFDAVHVRHGDVYGMLAAELPGWATGELTPQRLDQLLGHVVNRTAPFDFYWPAIDALVAQGRRIVFTSDTPETIAPFRARYGAGAFVDLSALSMAVVIQKAFADFLVLMDAGQVVGTSSNFSSLPGQIGGGRFVNVASTGPFASVEAAFRAALPLDEATMAAALARLEPLHAAFAARVAAMQRAQAARAERALAAAAKSAM